MTRTGRPPVPIDIQVICRMYNDQHLSTFEIAKQFPVSWATILRRLKAAGIIIRKSYGYPIWNKGLTVQTDERVRLNSEKTSRMIGHHHTDEAKAKMSQSQKGNNTWSKGSQKSPATKARNSAASKLQWQKPEYRQQQIVLMTNKWAEPGYAEKVIPLIVAGNIKKPTLPEAILLGIINKHNLPFKYTGDGAVVIAGLNPDFINCNGKKEVVEVFGDYWHSPARTRSWKATELGRIMAYNAYGFKCIILWEHEIKTLTEKELVGRLT